MIGIILVLGLLFTLGAIWQGLSLQMLVSVTVLILGILLARVFLRGKICAVMLHGLWFLVLLRMFACFLFCFSVTGTGPDSPWSINRAINVVVSQVAELEERDGAPWNEMEVEPTRFDLSTVELPWWIVTIWVTGTVLFCLVFSFLNERFRRKIFNTRVRIKVPDCPYPVYKVPEIPSPCVVNIRRQKGIYLTEKVAEDEDKRKYVLAHEICHIKHHDLFWAGVRNFVLACFWFHPFVWVAAVCSKRDNEMACDERALSMLGSYERKRYGEVLIALVDTTNRKEDALYLATTMTAGVRELKQRIQLISGGSHGRGISLLATALVSAILILTAFTSHINTANLTAEQVVRHFCYYSSMKNEHGMLALYPDAIWLANDYYGDSHREKVVKILNMENISGQGKNPTLDFDNYFRQYDDVEIFRIETIKRVYQEKYVGEQCISTPQDIKESEIFVVARETGSSWQIVYLGNGEEEIWEW